MHKKQSSSSLPKAGAQLPGSPKMRRCCAFWGGGPAFGAERLKKRRRCFRHALVSPVATTLQLCSVSCLSGRPLFSSAFNSVAHFPIHLESTLLCGSNVDGSSWFPITRDHGVPRRRGPQTCAAVAHFGVVVRPVLARWGVGHAVPRRARCWRGGVWVTRFPDAPGVGAVGCG